MSLAGKLAALTEAAQDFNKETESQLDGLMQRLVDLRRKRDAATQLHQAHLTEVEKGIDLAADVVTRLANVPLGS